MYIVICLPPFQMILSNVLVLEQVPPLSMDFVEESNIPPENEHSPSLYVADKENDVPPTVPSSEQPAADTIHHVEVADTI